jgi:hypothetical protein
MKVRLYRLFMLGTLVTFVSFGLVPLFAQHGHGGGGHGMGPAMGGGHEMGPTGSRSSQRGGKSPGELLAQNSKLSSKLQGLLPPGTNVRQAAAGFKNLGQFVAAVHVSHNLGIPFNQLKAEMVGSGERLGKAIHNLKPDVNSKDEGKRAQGEAKRDVEEGGS